MLILSRKVGDTILIGDGIRVVVLACDRGGVRLGVDAPASVPILRGEIVASIAAENQRAGATGAEGERWLRVLGGPGDSVKSSIMGTVAPAETPPAAARCTAQSSPS